MTSTRGGAGEEGSIKLPTNKRNAENIYNVTPSSSRVLAPLMLLPCRAITADFPRPKPAVL